MNYIILLFYKYTTIKDPRKTKEWQERIARQLNLLGRVLIAHEGINGTLSGSPQEINRYKEIMRKNSLFADIDFKERSETEACFEKLQIVVKKQIVNFPINQPAHQALAHTGHYLTPEQADKKMREKGKDLLILDTRNICESRIGAFENAIHAPVDHFRDLPAYIDQNLDLFKDKEVIMYCTGGVRCELATAYLNQKGVARNVYQIQGGIHRYAEQFPNGLFRGKNYVFDERIAVKVTDDILGTCAHCATACDDYTNCLNARCNKHFIGCQDCIAKLGNSCSLQCQELLEKGAVAKRPMRPKLAPISLPA